MTIKTFKGFYIRQYFLLNSIFYSITSVIFVWVFCIVILGLLFTNYFTFFSFPIVFLDGFVSVCLKIMLANYFTICGISPFFFSLTREFFSFCSLTILFITFAVRQFAFFGITIFFLGFCFAGFTLTKETILKTFTFMKIGNILDLFASTTGFCYDWFRHNLLLISKLCLESFTRSILVNGSFYYIGYL